MPCGRCRQLLWEHGGPDLLIDTAEGPKPMIEVLPLAFGREDLGGDAVTEAFDAVESSSPSATAASCRDEQIDWVISAYTRGVVADEQMSALAMAVLLRGLTRRRTRAVDRRDDRIRGAARPLVR